MATNFPASVDTLTNPVSTDSLNTPSHSAQHANSNDAIEAIETYLLTGAGSNDYARIIPTSATNATIASNGAVTVGTTVSSFTINGAFNSTYDDYKIIWVGGKSSDSGGVMLRMTIGSLNTGYYMVLLYQSLGDGVANSSYNDNYAFFEMGIVGGTASRFEIQLFGVNAGNGKFGNAQWTSYGAGLSIGGTTQMWNTSNGTTQTSFTFTPASGTFTGGQLYIYGLRK